MHHMQASSTHPQTLVPLGHPILLEHSPMLRRSQSIHSRRVNCGSVVMAASTTVAIMGIHSPHFHLAQMDGRLPLVLLRRPEERLRYMRPLPSVVSMLSTVPTTRQTGSSSATLSTDSGLLLLSSSLVIQGSTSVSMLVPTDGKHSYMDTGEIYNLYTEVSSITPTLLLVQAAARVQPQAQRRPPRLHLQPHLPPLSRLLLLPPPSRLLPLLLSRPRPAAQRFLRLHRARVRRLLPRVPAKLSTVDISLLPNIDISNPLLGQCGGASWTGPTTCAQGTCTYSNRTLSDISPLFSR